MALAELRQSAPPAAPRGRTAGGSPWQRSQRRRRIFFVLPALVIYGLTVIVPMVATLWIGFNSWSGIGPMEFVGLDNYLGMFRDPTFLGSFKNTLYLLLGGGAAVFIISFCLTMLLQNMWGRRGVRMIIFFPTLVPAIVISILWGFLFNPDGLINKILGLVGIDEPPQWLSRDLIFVTILGGIVWLNIGLYTVIFMAACDRIPPELYEVADLEGANLWQKFRYVTFPMLWEIVSVCSVLWCVGALKTFEFFLTFAGSTGMLPAREVWTFALYSYASAFAPDGLPRFGIAAASGVVILIFTFVLTALSLRLTRRDGLTY